MRKLVGWLCYLSLLWAIGFTCYYCYLTLAPFFRGGEIRWYGSDDSRWNNFDSPLGLPARLTELRPNTAQVALLRGFVLAGKPWRVWRSWETYPLLVDTSTTPKTAGPASDLAWGAVANASGKVTASYPVDLAVRMGHLSMHTVEGWLGALGAPARLHVFSVRTPQGRLLGSVAFADAPYDKVAVIPPGAGIDSVLSPFGALLAAAVSLLAFLILLPTWVAMDAEWRGMRSFAWVALILITGPIGLAAYFLARPRPPKPCPNCGETIQSGFKRCPACGLSLLTRCPKCGRKMEPGWQVCPVCSGEQPQEPQQAAQAEGEVGMGPKGHIRPIGPISPTTDSGLSVSVSDADSGAPLANARVAIAGPVTLDALTNRNGTFEARKLCTGHYSIAVTLDGYEPAHAESDVEEGSSQVARISLTAAPASIGGKVLDRQTMNPVCGAQVYLDSSRIDRSATTSGDGAFELENIPPGPYTVGVEAEGFVGQTRLVEAAPGRRASTDFALETEPRADQ